MIDAAIFERSKNQGVAFVIDLREQKRAEAERKRAEEALRKAQAELAHVTRLAALGELAASIAHEVNQPLTAIINNANACLDRLPVTRTSWTMCARVYRILPMTPTGPAPCSRESPGLFEKSPLQRTRLDVREAVSTVLILTRNDANTRRVTIN
jgi:signal transduction histidine kinase